MNALSTILYPRPKRWQELFRNARAAVARMRARVSVTSSEPARLRLIGPAFEPMAVFCQSTPGVGSAVVSVGVSVIPRLL
jgi:hypothetical protein